MSIKIELQDSSPDVTHTPAPWKASDEWIDDLNRETISIWGEDAHGLMTIAELRHTLVNPSANEQIANARLIAAAPELLEALKKCLQLLENSPLANSETAEIARAAINKAKG
jgi:hypothetical protein